MDSLETSPTQLDILKNLDRNQALQDEIIDRYKIELTELAKQINSLQQLNDDIMGEANDQGYRDLFKLEQKKLVSMAHRFKHLQEEFLAS